MKINIQSVFGESFTIFGLAILFSGAVNAGPTSTGGGASVVCDDSVEFYDLYEGRVLFGHETSETSQDPWEFVQSQIDQMPNLTDKAIFDHSFRTIRKAYSILPSGISLDKPEDMGDQVARVLPTGCRLEALGYFESNGRLRVSQDLLRRMSNTDIAAFLLHETLYLAARNSHREKDSYRTRLVVSSIFDRNQNHANIVAISELLRSRRLATIDATLQLASPGARVQLIRPIDFPNNPSSFYLECLNSEFESSTSNIFWGELEIPDECTYLKFKNRHNLSFTITGSNGQIIFDSRNNLPRVPDSQYSQGVYLIKNY